MTSLPVVAPATPSLEALLFSYWAGQEQLRALLDGQPANSGDDWDERLTVVVSRAVPAQLAHWSDGAAELLGWPAEQMRAVVELLLQPGSDAHRQALRQHGVQGRTLLALLAAPPMKTLAGRTSLPEQLSAIPAFGAERLAAGVLAAQLNSQLAQLELAPLTGRKLWRYLEWGWAMAEPLAAKRSLDPWRLRLLLLLLLWGWACQLAAVKRQLSQMRQFHQEKARLAGNRELLRRLEQLRVPAPPLLALLATGSQQALTQLRCWGMADGWYAQQLREWQAPLPPRLRSPYARALYLLHPLAAAAQLGESPYALDEPVTQTLQPLLAADELAKLLALRPKGLPL